MTTVVIVALVLLVLYLAKGGPGVPGYVAPSTGPAVEARTGRNHF